MSSKIGMKIKERRKALHMSADALAEKLGKNRTTIYRYESGDIDNVPIELLMPLAEALQTSPGYLIGWSNDKRGTQKKMDAPVDVLSRMETDIQFSRLLFRLNKFNPDEIKYVVTLLDAAEHLYGAEGE